MARHGGTLTTLACALCTLACTANAPRASLTAQQRWDYTSELLGHPTGLPRTNPVAAAIDKKPLDHSARTLLARTTVAIRTFSATADAPTRLLDRGTGVVIDRTGLILTNDHVIEGARAIEAFVPDVGWLSAAILNRATKHDLAVITVGRDLPVACPVDEEAELTVGEPVFAATLAWFEFDRHPRPATLAGQVLACNRSLQHALDPTRHRRYDRLLETTVPLPKGYSGGPLVTADGRLVGINTAAVTDPRSGRRLGYAIPLTQPTRGLVRRLTAVP